MNFKETPEELRCLLKAKFTYLKKQGAISDQMKGIEHPDCFLTAKKDSKIIELPPCKPEDLSITNLYEIIQGRESIRSYSQDPLSLNELSFLLWASQGIRKASAKPYIFFRNVPSAGCRHAFESYVTVHNVTGIEPGLYHYLPEQHALELLEHNHQNGQSITDIALGQSFVENCAATFFWSCVPYRMEWRYHIESCKLLLLDAGHVCQNFMLAAVAIKAGSCAIGAYDQEAADNYLGLNGSDEFVIYMASVGKTS
jgi:SagB-type dehydrogenase family enzyme